ncbi:hypothetical protein REPUB_Repub03eG0105400 [Reevesia pubescens]
MSKRAETTICWLLLATCTAVLFQPGLAELAPVPPLGIIPNLQGLLPPGTPLEIQECWSGLAEIQGCISEIFQSLFSGQFGSIGPNCCKAFTQIKQDCWPKMFPFQPSFPPFLKNFCAPITAPARFTAPSPVTK